jgi:hypothetical protein
MKNAKSLLEDLAAAATPEDSGSEELEMEADGRERLLLLVQNALGDSMNVGELNIAILQDAATQMPSPMWTRKILTAIDNVVRECGGVIDRTYTISWQQTALGIKVPGFAPMTIFKKLGSEDNRVFPAEQEKLAPQSLLLAGINELPSPSMVDLVFIVSNFNLGDKPEDLKQELRRYRDRIVYIYVGTGTPHCEVLDACHPGWKRQMVRAKTVVQTV